MQGSRSYASSDTTFVIDEKTCLHLYLVLLHPAKGRSEPGDLPAEEVRFGGNKVAQLPREDGVDGLAVAFREAFQGEDLEAGDAHVQVSQPE